MSIVFKDSFYSFNKDKYYNQVLKKSGISKKIDSNLITNFLKDILKQYNNLYSISGSIEKYLNSKRNERLFYTYKKNLLMTEANFRFISERNIFTQTFQREVLVGNSNSSISNRKGLNQINHFFTNMKNFIDKIENQEIENNFSDTQAKLLILYLFFDYQNESYEASGNNKPLIAPVIKSEMPKIKNEIKAFINNFNKYFEISKKDFNSCRNEFEHKLKSNMSKKNIQDHYRRENIVFILILNYENMSKCCDCINHLVENLFLILNNKSSKFKIIVDELKRNNRTRGTRAGIFKKIENDIINIIREIS